MKLRKVLKQPVTVGHFLLVLATVAVTVLMMGAKGEDPSFRAYAPTLSPTPQRIPVEPVVKTEVVNVVPEPSVAPTTVKAPETSGADGLTGSVGYARSGGNCVNEPGVNRAGGNPISWPALSRTPSIGATALWTYNHTGVVTGVWSNGDVEVRHQNYSGGQHRFPPSSFRGYR